MAQLFTEGEPPNQLTLLFPDAWCVVKYDRPGTYFYQRCIKPLGADLTAVDFVAASGADDQLWLIEVKDFRGHAAANRKRLTSGQLGIEIMNNFLDTLAGLAAGIHGKTTELQGLAAAFRNPEVELCVALLVAADPLPDRSNYKNLPASEQKRLDAEEEWRGDILQKFKSKLKKPFRFQVHLFDHQQIAARFGWSAY
jgi:hypothetical protein